jgi:hypothetical protein
MPTKKVGKPAKGKAVAVVVGGKKRSVGQAGVTPQPGTKKGNAYCARSQKIKKCANPPCPNDISRKRWGCVGSKSKK